MNYGMLTHFALELRADGTYAPFSADAWAFAGKMTLMGMGMVFAVLALLWGILAIFKLVFTGKASKDAKKASAPAAAPAPKAAPAAEPVAETDDSELIAVLAAAVAEYRAQEGTDGAFRVVSFKRANGGRAWNAKR